MKLSELVEFCSSPTADMYDLIGRPLNAMLTSNPFELRTRCSCVGIEERSCDASFDSIPTIPSTSTSWNQKYSMAMTNVKSAYYMKCGVELWWNMMNMMSILVTCTWQSWRKVDVTDVDVFFLLRVSCLSRMTEFRVKWYFDYILIIVKHTCLHQHFPDRLDATHARH